MLLLVASIPIERVLRRIEHTERYLIRCAARVLLYMSRTRYFIFPLTHTYPLNVLRYLLFARSRSAAISAEVITLIVLLGRELRNALP